eukprot:4331467-Prymnesium_polylepis.1
MTEKEAASWRRGIQILLNICSSADASPAHYRWALSCMFATNVRGSTGMLHYSDLYLLSKCANARLEMLESALRTVEENELRDQLPTWLRVRSTAGHHELTAEQVNRMLLQSCTSSDVLAALFS